MKLPENKEVYHIAIFSYIVWSSPQVLEELSGGEEQEAWQSFRKMQEELNLELVFDGENYSCC